MNVFDYDMIDKYLHGELNGESLQIFEKQMEENVELAKEVALYKNINSEMTLHFTNKDNEADLRKNLENINSQYFKSSSKNKVVAFNKWWLAVAAGIIGILVLILNPFAKPKVFNNTTLYAYHSNNINALPTVERSSNVDSIIMIATNLFNQKKYEDALPILADITNKDSTQKELLLALGICNLKTEKLETALTIFNTISKTENVFTDKAKWFTALVYLKQNKLDKCYKTLQLIPSNADDSKAATEIMKAIESNNKK